MPHNDGLKKRCDCSRRRWTKCPHPWHFGFQWNKREWRFCLNKVADKAPGYVMSRTEAESLRDHYRSEIRAGRFQDPTHPLVPALGAMTFNDLADRYLVDYVQTPTRRVRGRQTMECHIAGLRRVAIPVSGGRSVQFGVIPLAEIRQADVEALRRVWRSLRPLGKSGEVGANRMLARLRHMYNWAIAQGYIENTPFRRHGVAVVRLATNAETTRERRLDPGDEEKLIAVSSPRMQALVIAALETGCRVGELLSLQWREVRWEESCLVLQAAKTKTNESRAVPMTSRLRAVLEMRKHDPRGQEFGAECYVFGNAVGEKISYSTFKISWRKTLKRSDVMEGLHFHDLRREFASRLLETPGVSLHDVADWVGHSTVTTTARYLRTNSSRRQHIARRFEESRDARQATAPSASDAAAATSPPSQAARAPQGLH
jgi:integrase